MREFPEFSWLGDSLVQVSRVKMGVARTLLGLGYEAQGPEVAKALGISPEQLAEQAERADIERRSKKSRGNIPAEKPLSERRAYVAVRILCEFFARLRAPRPRLADGTPVDAAGALLLATAGLLKVAGTPELEAHPRAKPRDLQGVDGATAQRLGDELGELERGEHRDPDETETPLPDEPCGATRRNRRRANDARSQYDDETKKYQRKERLERAALAAGNRMRNPAGVKPLPLHEGRKARSVAHDRREALRFLMSLPPAIRGQLFLAGTNFGKRGRFCAQAMLIYALYAFLLWTSEAPRPCMRRSGFDRAAEGLCREALAVSFVWNAFTRSPFHANTLSAMVAQLECVGLVVRETPNASAEAYTGTTGWALNVYRFRNAEQLTELLKAAGIPVLPTSAAEGEHANVDPAPS